MSGFRTKPAGLPSGRVLNGGRAAPVYPVMRPPSRLVAGFAAVFVFVVALQASPDESGSPEPALETPEGTLALPVWQEGDCRESFEVRLWPTRTRIWLERENLRDQIADPGLPDPERAKRRQLLGIPSRWRMHSSQGNGHPD